MPPTRWIACPRRRAPCSPGAVALLHSPRAAAHCSRGWSTRPGWRAAIAIAAISAAAARRAGAGWRAAAVAAAPTDAALLAAAAKLCDQGG